MSDIQRGDVEATYQIHPPRPHDKTVSAGITAGIAIAMAALALALSLVGFLHQNKATAQQAIQIRLLNQANARLAIELAQDSTRLNSMTAVLTGDDPSSDGNLVTCRDLRQMNLSVTTGGSVNSVPGTVNLQQSAVSLPRHCGR
jgi:hypothetical protein